MELTSPIVPKYRKFSVEDERTMWNHLTENLYCYSTGLLFWKSVSREMSRNPRTLLNRFKYILAPNLHKADCDMETKLKIYKKCRIPVDRDYLKTLEEHAELTMSDGYIIESYKLIDRMSADKRKCSGDQLDSAKRARVEETVEDDQTDLLVDADVPGTGINLLGVILGTIKEEVRNDSHQGIENLQDVVSFEQNEETTGSNHTDHEEYSGEDGAGSVLLEGMENIQQAIVEEIRGIKMKIDRKMVEMSERMVAKSKEHMTKMCEEVSNAMDEKIARAVATIQAKIDANGTKLDALLRANEQDEVSNMRKQLTDLKSHVSLLESSQKEEIQKIKERIDVALQNLLQNDGQ